MSEPVQSYISCASGNNSFSDCLVRRHGDLIRLLGHAQMDFTAEDAARLGQVLIARALELGWKPKDNDQLVITAETKTIEQTSGDAIVDETIAMILARSRLGQEKYGTTLMRDDLDLSDWMRHAIEESLDLTLYLMRAVKDLEKLRDDGR